MKLDGKNIDFLGLEGKSLKINNLADWLVENSRKEIREIEKNSK